MAGWLADYGNILSVLMWPGGWLSSAISYLPDCGRLVGYAANFWPTLLTAARCIPGAGCITNNILMIKSVILAPRASPKAHGNVTLGHWHWQDIITGRIISDGKSGNPLPDRISQKVITITEPEPVSETCLARLAVPGCLGACTGLPGVLRYHNIRIVY